MKEYKVTTDQWRTKALGDHFRGLSYFILLWIIATSNEDKGMPYNIGLIVALSAYMVGSAFIVTATGKSREEMKDENDKRHT